MSTEKPPSETESTRVALAATDGLAAALEEVGFDVGREFPLLIGHLNSRGEPVVNVGRCAASVADRLTRVRADAAAAGITH